MEVAGEIRARYQRFAGARLRRQSYRRRQASAIGTEPNLSRLHQQLQLSLCNMRKSMSGCREPVAGSAWDQRCNKHSRQSGRYRSK